MFSTDAGWADANSPVSLDGLSGDNDSQLPSPSGSSQVVFSSMNRATPSPNSTHSAHSPPMSAQAVAAANKLRFLPPCRVCEMPASGFHYGVNTCEACKGFFRRALGRKVPYTCPKGGQCDVNKGARNVCPACRYTKCMSSGMAKTAIKTGRYTHQKRTNDTREIQGLTSPVASVSPSSAHSPTMSLLSPELSPAIPLPVTPEDEAAIVKAIGTSSITEELVSPSVLKKSLWLVSDLSSAFQESFPETSLFHLRPEYIEGRVEELLASRDANQSCFSILTSHPNELAMQLLSEEMERIASLNCNVLGCDNMILQDCPASNVSVSMADDGEEEDTKDGDKPVENETAPAKSPSGSPRNLDENEGRVSCQNEAKRSGPEKGSDSKTTSGCHTKKTCEKEQGESDTIPYYPERLVEIWTKKMEGAVRGLVKFAKHIPGFSQLSMSDQITLIKAGRGEAAVLLKFTHMDIKRQIVIDYQGNKDVLTLIPFRLLSRLFVTSNCVLASHQDLCSKFSSFQLRLPDVATFLALVIASPDRENLEAPECVEAIQDTILPALKATLLERHDAKKALPRLLLMLPSMRTHADLQRQHLDEIQSRYQIDFPPLLKEVLLR